MLPMHASQPADRQITSMVWAAALLLTMVAMGANGGAQQPPDSPPVVHLPGSHPPASGEPESSQDVFVSGSNADLLAGVDPAARQSAAQFAELTGVRQTIGQKFSTSIRSGLEEMRRQFPNLDPRFTAEWEKRMRAQFNVNDYVAVFINVYASHFTADELDEMNQAMRARKNSKPVTISPQLAEKIRANAVEIQSELIGGFSQLGARKGGEIGIEIAREHPDWVKGMIPAGKK